MSANINVSKDSCTTCAKLVMRMFPRTVTRLQRLDCLKTKAKHIAAKWNMFRLTNFGETSDDLMLMHHHAVTEFNKEKYWWMQSMHSLR